MKEQGQSCSTNTFVGRRIRDAAGPRLLVKHWRASLAVQPRRVVGARAGAHAVVSIDGALIAVTVASAATRDLKKGSAGVCVCVCVCVRERVSEREIAKKKTY